MALEDYKDLLSTTATITTVVQFLAGTTVCQKYVSSGSTGESSSVPFVSSVILVHNRFREFIKYDFRYCFKRFMKIRRKLYTVLRWE